MRLGEPKAPAGGTDASGSPATALKMLCKNPLGWSLVRESIFSEVLDPLKTISDDRFEDPKHILSILDNMFIEIAEVQNESKTDQ